MCVEKPPIRLHHLSHLKMLRNYIEFGVLSKGLPPEIRGLFQYRKPSFIYFYEIDPVIEFIWRWEYRIESYMGDRDVNVAWYFGDTPRIEYQFMDWPGNLKGGDYPLNRPDATRLDGEAPDLRTPRSRRCITNLIKDGPLCAGYEYIPLDIPGCSANLKYLWDYLGRMKQLEDLLLA